MTKVLEPRESLKRCEKCNGTYAPRQYNQKYCSESCAQSVAHAKHYRRHPEKFAARTEALKPWKSAYDRFRLTGWTPQEYEEAFKLQSGCCKICGRHQDEFKESLAADHEHSTGRKRGLLCGNCNRALGLLQDSVELIRKVEAYLQEYSNANASIADGAKSFTF